MSPMDDPDADHRALPAALEEEGLLHEILFAADRDHCPGARPIVSLSDDDEPAYLAEVARYATARIELERRGVWHGEWAELEDGVVPEPDASMRAACGERWNTARPVILPQLVDPDDAEEHVAERARLHRELQEEGGLRDFLKRASAALAPEFELSSRPGTLGDERDIERVGLTWCPDAADARAPRIRDLWAKSAWLSTHEHDASLRLRLSFGHEIEDDASRDLGRHLRVTELAERLLPESLLLHEHEALRELLAGWVGSPTFFTQHIAYWNAPGGGALFHHDAFDEAAVGGQRGVLYVQLSGDTAWLALSIEDLSRRVAEFFELLEEGELPWVRRALSPDDDTFERLAKLAREEAACLNELARPGCGAFAEAVNRGPEFTALLADAGHAFLLQPGDAVLLPNHGFARTCMHSVFGVNDVSSYAISLAIRERHPDDPRKAREGGTPSWRRAERRREREAR